MYETYVKELGGAFKYLPTWVPTNKLQLGDIIDRRTLEYRGRLNEHTGISFTSRSAPAHGILEYSSAGSVSVTMKLAGQVLADSALGEAEAGIIVRFSRENAIAFEASGCQSEMIADQLGLAKAVLALYKKNDWDRDLMVITEVIRAASVTVLISGGMKGQIELKANGGLDAGAARLSNLGGNLEARHESNVATKIIATRGLTPLYRASGIKRRWFRGPTFTGLRGDDSEFADFMPDDLLAESV
jgi:hypothetical protein